MLTFLVKNQMYFDKVFCTLLSSLLPSRCPCMVDKSFQHTDYVRTYKVSHWESLGPYLYDVCSDVRCRLIYRFSQTPTSIKQDLAQQTKTATNLLPRQHMLLIRFCQLFKYQLC